MKDHVSIDLETLGTRFTAAVLAIGAVQFDPSTGAIGQTFYREIDLASAIKSGTISAQTLQWWMTHPNAKEARERLFKNKEEKVSLATALDALATWIRGLGSPCVWGNGATFDISILEHAYLKGAVGLSEPWHYTNIRDMRTIVDVARYFEWLPSKQVGQVGTSHNALDDATFQAKVISACWQQLRKGLDAEYLTGQVSAKGKAAPKVTTFASDDEI